MGGLRQPQVITSVARFLPLAAFVVATGEMGALNLSQLMSSCSTVRESSQPESARRSHMSPDSSSVWVTGRAGEAVMCGSGASAWALVGRPLRSGHLPHHLDVMAAVRELIAEGWSITFADLAVLSPYLTASSVRGLRHRRDHPDPDAYDAHLKVDPARGPADMT